MAESDDVNFLRPGQSVQISLVACDKNSDGTDVLIGSIQQTDPRGVFLHHSNGAALFVPWSVIVTVKKQLSV